MTRSVFRDSLFRLSPMSLIVPEGGRFKAEIRLHPKTIHRGATALRRVFDRSEK